MSFESLLQAPVAFSVPRPVLLQPLSPVVLSKRSWDLAFSDSDLPRLTWREEEPARPVARALFSDHVDVQPVQVPPPAAVKARRRRKTLAPTPIVDTVVRCCTRSSAQRDGFKPTFQELALQPKRKKPKAKPLFAEMLDDPAHADVPPPIHIIRLQAIGKELEIDAKLLTMDALWWILLML